LRAVTTVLRAKTTLGILEEVEMHLLAEMLPTDAKCGCQEIQQIIVIRLKDAQSLIGG
jgi:hypothetical protein